MTADPEHLADPYFDAGVACCDLIVDPASWINRRVETIEMLTREETRRRVSIDFTLPAAVIDELALPDGVVVPISALTKEPRRNFDLRDEGGASVPVLGKRQNGDLAHIALMSAAIDALPNGVPPEVLEMLAAELRLVVLDAPVLAAEALGHFIAAAEAGDPWRTAVWEDPKCQALLNTLWVNYVLFAVLPRETRRRRVLKYSYGEDFALAPDDEPLRERLRPSALLDRIWRPDRKHFVIECPGAWRASSFHVEIAIPEELRFELAVLFDRETTEMLSAADTNVNRAALYASEPFDELQNAAAYAAVVPERPGRTFLSASIGVTVAALLWLGVASELDAENPGAAVALLLAGAAVFSGLVASQGQHRIVRRAFAASRRWLAIVAASALGASASLAMEIPCEHPVDVWRVCAAICAAAALRLTWSAVRAPG